MFFRQRILQVVCLFREWRRLNWLKWVWSLSLVSYNVICCRQIIHCLDLREDNLLSQCNMAAHSNNTYGGVSVFIICHSVKWVPIITILMVVFQCSSSVTVQNACLFSQWLCFSVDHLIQFKMAAFSNNTSGCVSVFIICHSIKWLQILKKLMVVFQYSSSVTV